MTTELRAIKENLKNLEEVMVDEQEVAKKFYPCTIKLVNVIKGMYPERYQMEIINDIVNIFLSSKVSKDNEIKLNIKDEEESIKNLYMDSCEELMSIGELVIFDDPDEEYRIIRCNFTVCGLVNEIYNEKVANYDYESIRFNRWDVNKLNDELDKFIKADMKGFVFNTLISDYDTRNPARFLEIALNHMWDKNYNEGYCRFTATRGSTRIELLRFMNKLYNHMLNYINSTYEDPKSEGVMQNYIIFFDENNHIITRKFDSFGSEIF